MPVFNHVGHCVRDLERSQRFYVEALGFTYQRVLKVPDQPTSKLLRLEAPLGMTAVYLARDGLVLELMEFQRSESPETHERVMNEPGLTHLSFCVDDIAETVEKVAELGGSVLADTDLGAAIFVRDPDGQLIELLPMAYRRSIGQ